MKKILFLEKNNINLGLGKILESKKIKNGYFLKISVQQKGLLVFNNFHNSFWKAYDGKDELDLANINDYQMARGG